MSAVLSGAPPAEREDSASSVAPDAFWKSLFYFNLSRMLLAAVLLGAVLIYGDGRVFGTSNPKLFYHTCVVYFLLSMGFAWALNRVRTMFTVHLAVQAVTDVVIIIFLLHASGISSRIPRPERMPPPRSRAGAPRWPSPRWLPWACWWKTRCGCSSTTSAMPTSCRWA